MGDTKIGQRLIESGLITEKQLENALKAQLIVGGHLGTCLIELGLIDEESLGQALSESFGVPAVPAEALLDIPDPTIRMVPARVADEFQVIPFRISQKTLHMALVDPSNLPALDALSFATDMRIVPWIAPELRIYQALERYYGVPRRLRYLSICRALDETASRSQETKRKRIDGPAGVSAGGSGGSASSPELNKATATIGVLPDADKVSSFDDELGFDYGKTWHDVAAELRLDEPPERGDLKSAASSFTGVATMPQAGSGGTLEITDVADRLCKVDTKEEVVETFFAYANGRMARSILFSVNKNVATPWRAQGFDQAPNTKARLPLSNGIFELLLGNELYRGAVPREAKYEASYRSQGIERPSEILLVPLYLSDRLVAIFHGDGGPKGKVAGDTDDYLRLFRLFSPTMNLILVKNKIRDAAHPPPEVRKKPQTV